MPTNASARRAAYDFRVLGPGNSFGSELFVDTVNGLDANRGDSPSNAFKTMEAALNTVADNGTVYFRGTVSEHLTAPLGVQGVKIVGLVGGRTRHDDGARWQANAGGSPLLTIREQGWEFHNFLFVPQSGYSAIRAHRAESATYPDSSHFICRGMRFVGPGAFDTTTGIGIEDWGGNHHYLVEDCEFSMLEFAIVAPAGSPGIAAPLRDVIKDCFFDSNKHDICMDMSRGRILHNTFNTPYHGTTHPNIVNLAYLSDVSGRNVVAENYFPDAITAIDDDHGYVESTGDIWANNWASTANSAAAGAPWGGVPADS